MLIDKSTVLEITREHGTPYYLTKGEKLKKQYEMLVGCFPDHTRVAYATKANYSESVIEIFRDLDTSFDVFSPGELNHLLDCNCDPEKFIYTSVSETEKEFDLAIRKGVKTFVLGSMKGIERFVKTAEESGTTDDLDILLRTQPLKKVAARVSTSGKHSKFGFVFEEAKDSVDNALNKLKEKGLQLSGLHCHLGSQIKNPETYVEAIRKMLSFAVEEIPNIKKLDIGGGFPARYHENVPEISTVGEKIEKEMKYWRKKLGDIELILEPGRFLTSMAGILVSKIVNVKHMYGRKILILNVSEDMVEVERHGKIATPSVITEKEELVETSIAGNLCHSNDWISREPQMLPDAESGDIIVFENLGAYQINHNIPYNLRPLPKILTMIDGKVIENNHPFTLITN